MKHAGRGLRRGAFAPLVLFASWLAHAAPLDVHGTVHPGACEPRPWQALQARIKALQGGPAAPSPEPLIRALLCGNGPADQAALLAAAPGRIPHTSEATGEPTVRRKLRASEVLTPLAGDAWDVSLERVRGELRLHFQANEACVRSVVLRLQREGWRFVRADEGCD